MKKKLLTPKIINTGINMAINKAINSINRIIFNRIIFTFILMAIFIPVFFFLGPVFVSEAEGPNGYENSYKNGYESAGDHEHKSHVHDTIYEYEKKEKEEDKAKEKKRVIAKLREDRQKCDLAIDNTKVLIDRARNKPYLPEMYLRLAELYIEKSRLIYFLRKAESTGTSVKSLEQLESNALKNQAIEIYQGLLDNFPDFKDLDKVHFFLAHEYRELAQIESMIAQYRAIISKYKDSPYAAESYLLLGDYFFNMQDLDMAQRHYESVLNYPQSSAIAIARYKLAWCYINRTNFQEAIKLFEESVTSLTDTKELDIDTYKRVNVKIEAMIDMAYCYCECYKESTPQQAMNYFEKYAWSRPVYTLVLDKLAYRYLLKNKWSHAAAIYRKLATLSHDTEKLLEYSRKIFECVQAMDHFEDADQDVAIMVAALRQQKYYVHIAEKEKKKNRADFELYARDMITHLHQKARANKSKKDFIRAADSYKTYLDFFDSGSRTYREMEANYAEALFSAQRYLEAGRQYEKRAQAISQKNRQREGYLYSAVLSYYKALRQKNLAGKENLTAKGNLSGKENLTGNTENTTGKENTSGEEPLTYYEIASARGGLKACGKAYTSDFPGSLRVSNVLFNVAWITYDEGKYDEAIAEFSRFVDRYPKGEEARAAIHLVLDAFNLKEDYAGLVKYGQKILKSKKIQDEELKSEIAAIVQASESKIICSLTVAAVNDWDNKLKRDNSVGGADKQKDAAMGEYALYALLVPSKEKGDIETLFASGSQLIERYPGSTKIEETLNLMIESSLKISQFRLLAQYLEDYAARLPKQSNCLDFLYQAARIREGLGQYDLANRDYQAMQDRGMQDRGTKGTHTTEEIMVAMADNAEQKGDRDFALKILQTSGDRLSPGGQIKADARIADLYAQNDEFDKAGAYAIKAKKAYKPDLASQEHDLPAIMAKMEYDLLDQSFREYMGMQLKGSIDNNLVAAKAKLLETLDKGCQTVIHYQSPKMALAACYRSYEIYREFGRFLKESPLPELNSDEKEQYLQLIDQQAQVYFKKADQYRSACIEKAHSWEICDPGLAKYFLTSSEQLSGQPSGQLPGQLKDKAYTKDSGFSKAKPLIEITSQCFKDEVLRGQHQKLLEDQNSLSPLLALAETYREKGDVRLSILIAQEAINKADGNDGNTKADSKTNANSNTDARSKAGTNSLKAQAYNTLGVSYLTIGEDSLAKDAFTRALVLDAHHIGARINLAGLYQHYGHTDKAKSIYQSLPDQGNVEEVKDAIHPQAREFYYAYLRG